MDGPHPYGYYLANGIVLVSRRTVERLQDDDQLAQLIADDIAGVIEKQEYRLQPAHRKMLAAQIAADGGGLFIPGLGLAASVANASVQAHLMRLDAEQRGRESLMLMHDAGYDIHKAPVTWRLLAGKPSKKLDEINMPSAAEYSYCVLGSTWRDTGWLTAEYKTPEPVTSGAAGPSHPRPTGTVDAALALDTPEPGVPRLSRSTPAVLANAGPAVATSEPRPDAAGNYRAQPGVVEPPKLTYSVNPEFTKDARKHRLQGVCVVKAAIDANGLVKQASVERSMGSRLPEKDQKYAPALDENAIAAVRQYRFEPATLQGNPVPVEIRVEINFHLQ